MTCPRFLLQRPEFHALSAPALQSPQAYRFGLNSPYLETSRLLRIPNAIHGFDFTSEPHPDNRQPKCQTARAAWFSLARRTICALTTSKSSGIEGHRPIHRTMKRANCLNPPVSIAAVTPRPSMRARPPPERGPRPGRNSLTNRSLKHSRLSLCPQFLLQRPEFRALSALAHQSRQAYRFGVNSPYLENIKVIEDFQTPFTVSILRCGLSAPTAYRNFKQHGLAWLSPVQLSLYAHRTI